jgi:hypothetical protein
VGQGGNLGLCSDHSCVDFESRMGLIPGTSGKTMERYIYIYNVGQTRYVYYAVDLDDE